MTEEELKYHEEAARRSRESRNPNVEMFGDRNTVIQLITLLSFIRHAIKNHIPTEIDLKIATNKANGEFDFMVDGELIDDLIAKKEFEIN